MQMVLQALCMRIINHQTLLIQQLENNQLSMHTDFSGMTEKIEAKIETSLLSLKSFTTAAEEFDFKDVILDSMIEHAKKLF